MSANDLRDDMDTELASTVGTDYSGATFRSAFKTKFLQGLANAIFPYFGGDSVWINETPDLPATTFSASPVRQYVIDDTSARQWSSYWENSIGTLTITGAGAFQHVPNLGFDQQLLTSFNRAPRLMTPLPPMGPKMTLEATAVMTGVSAAAGGLCHVGIGVFGLDVITGTWAHCTIRLNRNTSNQFSARGATVINGTAEATLASGNDATYAAGLDLRCVKDVGRCTFEYKKTTDVSYTSLGSLPLGGIIPSHAIIYIGHTSGLSTPSPTLSVTPTLLKVEQS